MKDVGDEPVGRFVHVADEGLISAMVIAAVGGSESVLPRSAGCDHVAQAGQAVSAGDGLRDDRHAGFVVGLPRRPGGGDDCPGGVGDDVWREGIAAQIGRSNGAVVADSIGVGAVLDERWGGFAVSGWCRAFECAEQHVEPGEEIGSRSGGERFDGVVQGAIELAVAAFSAWAARWGHAAGFRVGVGCDVQCR